MWHVLRALVAAMTLAIVSVAVLIALLFIAVIALDIRTMRHRRDTVACLSDAARDINHIERVQSQQQEINEAFLDVVKKMVATLKEHENACLYDIYATRLADGTFQPARP